MNSNSDRLESLRRTMFEAYQSSYNDISTEWRAIDSKAQSTTTVAGLFVAGIFTLLGNTNVALNTAQQWILPVMLVLLAASIIFLVRAMLITEVVPPPGGGLQRELIDYLARNSSTDDAEIEDRINCNYNDLVRKWEACIASRTTELRRKATAVAHGQIFTVLSTVIALFLLLTSITS